jgi:phosphatidylinositol-3-phosphatase
LRGGPPIIDEHWRADPNTEEKDMRRGAFYGLILTVSLACSGCSHHATTAEKATTVVDSSGTASAPAARDQPITKLLVIVVENHSFDQMRTEMPYTALLAHQFGYATNFRGVTYPSLPNYIAITSGSTHGITDDKSPVDHRLPGPTIFGQAISRGKSAALYADGMPTNCAHTDGGDRYAVKHNPWAYYPSEDDACEDHDVPGSELADAAARGDLPNVGMVVPNMCHDAHDCDLSVADKWINQVMRSVLGGSDWTSGHLAVVITADTDDRKDRKDRNRILTVVIHPSQHSNVVDERLDHYSLSRLFSEVLHAPPLSQAANASSMSVAFGLPLEKETS